MRIAVLSDIHANLEALEAVLRHVSSRRIDAVWFLGDAVGYGGSAEEVVRCLDALDVRRCVRGNHDKVIAGIEEPHGFSHHARKAALRTRELISAEGIKYLRSLPQGPIEAGEDTAICHGSWADEDRYILTLGDAAATFEEMNCSTLFFGHTHRACLYAQQNASTLEVPYRSGVALGLRSDVRYLINPGSVGQPRDFDPRASYVLFDPDEGKLAFFRVPYDIGEAQRKIVKAGLPELNAARLAEGR